MDLVTANALVDTFLNNALDLQTLAKEETDPRIVRWLHKKAAEYTGNASEVVSLPLEGWDWLCPVARSKEMGSGIAAETIESLTKVKG